MAAQSRQAQRPGAAKDAEGTGVWTPNWDDDEDEPVNRRPAQPVRHQPDPTTRRYYVPPPSQRGPQRPDPADAPTDFIPRHHGREPQLFTHREPEPPQASGDASAWPATRSPCCSSSARSSPS
jgi:hypothetical protein